MDPTGPTTPEGKARSSRNALKHGLRSRDIVLPGEDPEEWHAFRDDYVAALDPLGLAEEALAYRAAELYWRLLRVAEVERKAVAAREESPEQYIPVFRKAPQWHKFRPPVETPDMLPEGVASPSALRPLIRYEAHLSRQFHLAMRGLQDLQDRRRGTTTRVTRVEVHGYPNQLKETRPATEPRRGASPTRPIASEAVLEEPSPPRAEEPRNAERGPSSPRVLPEPEEGAQPSKLPNELLVLAGFDDLGDDDDIEEDLAHIDPDGIMGPLREFALSMARPGNRWDS